MNALLALLLAAQAADPSGRVTLKAGDEQLTVPGGHAAATERTLSITGGDLVNKAGEKVGQHKCIHFKLSPKDGGWVPDPFPAPQVWLAQTRGGDVVNLQVSITSRGARVAGSFTATLKEPNPADPAQTIDTAVSGTFDLPTLAGSKGPSAGEIAKGGFGCAVLVLMGAALLGTIGFGIWLTIGAFQYHAAWGLFVTVLPAMLYGIAYTLVSGQTALVALCVLATPAASIVYALRHWDTAKWPFLLTLVSWTSLNVLVLVLLTSGPRPCPMKSVEAASWCEACQTFQEKADEAGNCATCHKPLAMGHACVLYDCSVHDKPHLSPCADHAKKNCCVRNAARVTCTCGEAVCAGSTCGKCQALGGCKPRCKHPAH